MSSLFAQAPPQAGRTGLIQHSTEFHRGCDKVAFWADLVCQHFVPAECHSVSAPERFHGEMAMRQMGRVNVAEIVAGGQRVARTSNLVARASEEYFLVNIQDAGHSELAQGGRLARLNPGDMAIFSSAEAFRLSFEDDFAQTVLTFPADELRRLVPDVDALTATTLDGHGAAARLFANIAHYYFETDTGTMPAEAAEHAASGLIEILAGTLSSQRAAEPAKRPRLARFHLARIKQYAMHKLQTPELSLASVSSALRISPSHIHRLFASEAQTFSTWLWSCRLIACKKELEDPGQAHRTISEIAFDNGFNNSAHFSRTFRAKFSVSPRECRATRVHSVGTQLAAPSLSRVHS